MNIRKTRPLQLVKEEVQRALGDCIVLHNQMKAMASEVALPHVVVPTTYQVVRYLELSVKSLQATKHLLELEEE